MEIFFKCLSKNFNIYLCKWLLLSETLRKYPPLPILNREVLKDYYLQEYNCVLEKGTPILIPVIGLHRDPKYFPDPDEFDPEHFNEENKRSRHQYVYLPFGEGPRNCIGKCTAKIWRYFGNIVNNLNSLISNNNVILCKWRKPNQ